MKNWGLRKNRKWKKLWKQTLAYSYDWDADFMIEIIMRKIELMRDYFKNDCSILSSDIRMSMVKEMNDTLTIGKRILADDYDEAPANFLSEHMIHVARLYPLKDHGLNKYVYSQAIGKDWLFDDGDIEDNYCDFLGVPRGTLKGKYIVAYTGVMDSQENERIYEAMLNDAMKFRDDDYKKFFANLANFSRGWCD